MNIIDEDTRLCLVIKVYTSPPVGRVARKLDGLEQERGFSEQIRVENGRELIAAEFYSW